MRAVVQRALGARVTVGDDVVGAFEGSGLVVLLAVTHDDGAAQVRAMARKLAGLRILDGELSPSDLVERGEAAHVLVVSQFTLYGDTRKGRRPSWSAAAPGPVAEPIVDAVVDSLRAQGLEVSTGRFGADMQVRLTNDGPFTVIVEV